MTPLGVGNDLGGSLRWPAQCTGICSLKPTLGRVPQAAVTEPVDSPISIQLMAVQGPMARHVADLRLALEAMSRPSDRDPWYVPVSLAGEPLAHPVRVAVVTDPGGRRSSPQVAEGVRRAARALADAGFAVEEVEPPDIGLAAETWLQMLGWDLRFIWELMSQLVSEDANRFMGLVLETLPPPDAAVHLQAFLTRQALARRWAEFQRRHPVIIGPVATEPPFSVGTDLTADGVAGILASLPLVVAINLLGLPAAVVPTGVGDGLPQAVQVIGARFREDACLLAAEVIEEACGIPTPIDPR